VTVTLGPQNLPQVLPGSLFTQNAGQVMTFDTHFASDSTAGQVSGDKTLVVDDPGNQAACIVAASALADIGLGPQTIQTDSGYAAGGQVTFGNVQVS
jgi:hypothetical protein